MREKTDPGINSTNSTQDCTACSLVGLNNKLKSSVFPTAKIDEMSLTRNTHFSRHCPVCPLEPLLKMKGVLVLLANQ